MKHWQKILLASILILLGIAFISFSLYKLKFSMEIAKPFEVNTTEMPHHVLIATQGSQFKNAVVSATVDHFSGQHFYLKVIDVHDLDSIREKDWNVIVLIHTWENSQPPEAVKKFWDRQHDLRKIIVFTTSGQGHQRLDTVDGITSASDMKEVDAGARKIISRIEELTH